MGVWLFSVKYLFAFEKGLEPKKPLFAEKGEGCGEVRTKCLIGSISCPFSYGITPP